MKEEELARLKKALVQGAHILDNEGILDFLGHFSARIPGEDKVLITPLTADAAPRNVTAADLATVDLEGRQVGGKARAPGESWLHIAIYRARPDVGAIVHAHPPACIALGVAETPPLPLYNQAGRLVHGVPLYRRPGLVDSQKLGEEVATLLGKSAAALLKWHGVVVVGETIEEAGVLSIVLEQNARIQIMAAALGKVDPLPASGVDFRLMVPPAAWNYFASRLEKGARPRSRPARAG